MFSEIELFFSKQIVYTSTWKMTVIFIPQTQNMISLG